MSSQCTDTKCREECQQHIDLKFYYYYYYYYYYYIFSVATLRITTLSWQDGQNQMGKGRVYMKPIHFLTLTRWLCAGESFIMDKE